MSLATLVLGRRVPNATPEIGQRGVAHCTIAPDPVFGTNVGRAMGWRDRVKTCRLTAGPEGIVRGDVSISFWLPNLILPLKNIVPLCGMSIHPRLSQFVEDAVPMQVAYRCRR